MSTNKTNKPVRTSHPKPQVFSVSKSETSVFIGPLPAPQVLQQYEQAHPGIAERILQMAEREQSSRLDNERRLIDMEAQTLRSSNWNIIRGQAFALASVLIIVGLCAYFAWLGKVEEASSAAKWIIVSLAGVFITGRIVFKSKAPKE